MKSLTNMTGQQTAKTKRLSIGRTAFFGASLMALAACSSAPARDADIFYDLRPELAETSYGSSQVLLVQSVSVKGIQSARPLVVETATSPVQLQDVRGHLWHEAPSSLIETAITDALIAASQDLVIGTNDTVDNEDLRLKIIVSKFHFTPSQAAHFAFDAVLKNKRGQIISSKRYDVSEPLSGTDYSDAVIALEKAMTKALKAVQKDIAAAL